MLIGRVVIIPAGRRFFQTNGIWRIAINLVCRHKNERRFGTKAAAGFQQIHGAHGIGIEIVKRHGCSQVMGRLSRCVHVRGRPYSPHQIENAAPVPHIELVMRVIRYDISQAFLVPASIALRPKKYRSLAVIQAMNSVPPGAEKQTHFRPNQSRRACYEDGPLLLQHRSRIAP